MTRALVTTIVPPKIAYLKDYKTSGTGGGTCAADTVYTRDLNAIEGDTSFITLPTGFTDSTYDNNGATPDTTKQQFTLAAGTYEIYVETPAFQCNRHQAFLYDVTNSSYEIDGSSTVSGSAYGTATISHLRGTLELTSATAFEIRHWTQSAYATSGLGQFAYIASNNPQSHELYTTVKITKIG